ncbi:MAG: saccharopine dehydrogenase family protein [Thermovirgaceae bacterium]
MSDGKVLLLGCGMQGKAALYDLLGSDGVTKIVVADASSKLQEDVARLQSNKVEAVKLDADNCTQVKELMAEADVVVELLPGSFAFGMAELAVEVGVDLITSMYLVNPGEQDAAKAEKQRKALSALSDQARQKGVTILQEFGMDPGVDLVLGKRALEELDEVKAFHSYGAGFPELSAADNPLRYKFTWSIIGVMKSYLRPAKILDENRVVEIPADEMFAPKNTHLLDLAEMGSPLECFPNGDALAFAEVFGLGEAVESMGRYICRWPGHGSFWWKMAKSGFLRAEPVSMNGAGDVAPVEFCASLLASQDQFYYREDERDVALVRSDVRGTRDGKPVRVVWQITDYRDLATGFTAMQRTVGFPMSIGAQMIMDGTIDKKGVIHPMEVPFDPFMKELGNRGIQAVRFEEEWDGDLKP